MEKENNNSSEASRRIKVLFEAIWDNSSIAIYETDANGQCLSVNKEWCKLAGISKEDALRDGWQERLHPDDKERIFALWTKHAKTKKPWNFEYRFQTPENVITWVLGTSNPIINKQGEITGYIGVNTDITERKMAEQAIKESEEKTRLLIKNSNDIIIIVNEDGEQVFISDVIEDITGYTADELYGNIKNVIHPEDLELVWQHWNEVLLNTNKSVRVQYRHIHKKNGFVWLEAVAQNFIEIPSIKGVVINIRDITEQKKAEKALIKSEKQQRELNTFKNKLFSIIAHDLRSPLNNILGFSELLIEKIPTCNIEEATKFANIINTSAKNELHLLDSLLTWGKTQTERIEFIPENLKLNSIVQEVFLVLNFTASHKNIKLISSFSDDIVVYADPNMLSTILRNLISNAIKFTNSEGIVDINAAVQKKHIEISVTDNGVGINEENNKKLFGADINFTMRGTQNEGGSGLGLVLCKEFVEKHQGKIWIESEVGKGSKFIFTLPISTK